MVHNVTFGNTTPKLTNGRYLIQWKRTLGTSKRYFHLIKSRMYHTATFCNGYIYIIGDFSVKGLTAAYDPFTKSLLPLPPLAIASASNQPIVVTVNNKVYVTAGPSILILETDGWKTLGHLPEKRFWYSAIVVDNHIYILGGRVGNMMVLINFVSIIVMYDGRLQVVKVIM